MLPGDCVFLHGGADAKALMWVALVFPSWATVPTPLSSVMGDTLVALPVAVALLMWGGLAFLLIPFIMLILNIKKGSLRSFGDLRLAWHATKIPIDEVLQRHVWMLTTTMVRPDGQGEVIHRSRAPRRTPNEEELQQQIMSFESPRRRRRVGEFQNASAGLFVPSSSAIGALG